MLKDEVLAGKLMMRHITAINQTLDGEKGDKIAGDPIKMFAWFCILMNSHNSEKVITRTGR